LHPGKLAHGPAPGNGRYNGGVDPFAEIRHRLPGALSVYVSTWCWDCIRLRRFLKKHDVPHELVNVSDSPKAAEKLIAETGKRGVPAVLVHGRQWVRGYHTEAHGNFDPGLFVRELAAAL
jgi:glutaredoxin